MAIRIIAERQVIRGDALYRIKKVEGVLSDHELPREYMKSNPHAERRYDGVDIWDSEGEYMAIRETMTYSPSSLEQRIEALRACGDRLARINKEISERTRDWHGEVEFVV